MIVISDSDSDSDSEFVRDVQEVTRWSLMTVELSPVREAVSDSDDDEGSGQEITLSKASFSAPSWLSGESLRTRLSL